jgi:hypothetical protein
MVEGHAPRSALTSHEGTVIALPQPVLDATWQPQNARFSPRQQMPPAGAVQLWIEADSVEPIPMVAQSQTSPAEFELGSRGGVHPSDEQVQVPLDVEQMPLLTLCGLQVSTVLSAVLSDLAQ